MLDRLYRAYFSERRSVFDADSLVPLAAETGLEASETRAVLQGSHYSHRVYADQKEARLLGVSGVPFFVVDDRYGVSGAQPVEVFRQVLAHAVGARALIWWFF